MNKRKARNSAAPQKPANRPEQERLKRIIVGLDEERRKIMAEHLRPEQLAAVLAIEEAIRVFHASADGQS